MTRYVYTIKVGVIGEGLIIMHSCDEPSCINPEHLSAGTVAENNADMVAKNRHAKGDGFRHSKMTDEKAAKLRMRHAQGGITQDQLAEEFGISRGNVGFILRRERWKHV